MAKRNVSKPRPAPHRTPPSLPETVGEVVEEERLRLMKAHSLLACTVAAMEADEAMRADGPYYPALIEMAGELIDESIRRLDSVHLRTAAMRHGPHDEDRGDSVTLPAEVREPRSEYVVSRRLASPPQNQRLH
ncbi:MAG: hypothetical protein DIU71_11770 [Proteobacteria bacterium]|nr:MAG: hypothetical protein DIU71_11770 [Pseudomonadota bacterium]